MSLCREMCDLLSGNFVSSRWIILYVKAEAHQCNLSKLNLAAPCCTSKKMMPGCNVTIS